MTRGGRYLPLLAIAGWLLAVGGASAGLTAYQGRPGPPAAAPETWPRESALSLAADRPTLLLLAHPRCPCTRATLAELGRLLARLGDRLAAQVVFVRPAAESAGWEHTDLVAQAKAIAGVAVRFDPGGVESRRFGSATSGQVLLYRPDGSLAFAGGITRARGHQGDNPGAERIAALVAGRAAPDEGPVYGCALDHPTRSLGGSP